MSTNGVHSAPAEQQVIRQARSAQGMNVRDFSAAVGVSYQSISFWENGERAVDDDRIKAWMLDVRPWVKQLGFNLFIARHGDTLAAMSQAIQHPNANEASI